jgi:hypothetical protein
VQAGHGAAGGEKWTFEIKFPALKRIDMSNQIQSWTGLPEHVKRQAAPDMLPAVEWHYHLFPDRHRLERAPFMGSHLI